MSQRFPEGFCNWRGCFGQGIPPSPEFLLIQRAKALRKEGLSYRAIAEKLGTNKSYIYRWINRS